MTNPQPPSAAPTSSGPVREYVQRRYWAGTLGPLIVLLALLVLSIVRYASGSPARVDPYVLVIVPIVLGVNILGMRQPRRIVDTPESLVLEGMRRRQSFPWSRMTSVKVKEFAFTDRVYIRIEPSSFLGGSFWVDLHKYPDLEQLKKKLLDKEAELHPERVKYQRSATPAPRRKR